MVERKKLHGGKNKYWYAKVIGFASKKIRNAYKRS